VKIDCDELTLVLTSRLCRDVDGHLAAIQAADPVVLVLPCHQPAIGDGDPMRIALQVGQHRQPPVDLAQLRDLSDKRLEVSE
jgi:hypothetical protein